MMNASTCLHHSPNHVRAICGRPVEEEMRRLDFILKARVGFNENLGVLAIDEHKDYEDF